MSKKVVFVFNSSNDTRCMRRVEEFVEYGYQVDVYGFDRGGNVKASSKNFDVQIVGKHDISMNYFHRAIIIWKSLKKLFKKYHHEDVIYFLFFFDVAFIGHLIANKPYIYELSDMPYSNMKIKLFRRIFEIMDRRIIKKSLLTTLTSEGFIDYLFNGRKPANYVVTPNGVDKRMIDLPYSKGTFDINHLRFSFVGGFRYKSTLEFFRTAAKNFPQHTFAVDGNIMHVEDELNEIAKIYPNIQLNGVFKYPDDSPAIYERTDIVLSNYDADSINAQYAEPNKLYEAIFFRTPIIVSSNTFLSKKVKQLGIGFDVDSFNENAVVELISSISKEILQEKINNCKKIPQEDALCNNPLLFKYLRNHGI